MIRRIPGDLTLALLKAVACQRFNDFLGFGDPAVAGSVHAAAATELEQTIVHVSPPFMATTPVVATNERAGTGCNAAASTCRTPGERTIADAKPKSRGSKPQLVGPMLTDTNGDVVADDAASRNYEDGR